MSLELRIPRRLESPNKSRGAHWRVRHQITLDWEKEIWVCVAKLTKAKTIGAVLACMNGLPDLVRHAPRTRQRVTIERHVPSARNFIRDDDNLRFASKPILDALKRQAYIKDDSRKWLQHPTPTQHVSADGKDWTVIRIQPGGHDR